MSIVNLHLWVFVCMFFGNIFAVHNPVGMAALDFDDLRNDELNCIFGFKYGRISGRDRKKRNVYSVRYNWFSSNYSFSHIQVGVF